MNVSYHDHAARRRTHEADQKRSIVTRLELATLVWKSASNEVGGPHATIAPHDRRCLVLHRILLVITYLAIAPLTWRLGYHVLLCHPHLCEG